MPGSVELKDPVPPRSSRRTQLLSLSGGGFRGLFTARLLEELERRADRPLAEAFEVLAGTSIGGILAIALAVGRPASALRSTIEAEGPRLFASPSMWRRLVRAPYSNQALRRLIVEILGEAAEQSLRDVEIALVIPAVSQSAGRPRIFRSRGLAGAEADDLSLVDTALATAAAPTYFPPHRSRTENLVDGGLIANAPELVAVIEMLRNLAVDLPSVHVLSLGTAAPPFADFVHDLGRRGLAGWANELVRLVMQSQERLAVEQCRALLGGRYHRIDRQPLGDQGKVLGLDRADRRAADTLLLLAEEAIVELASSRTLQAFLEHRAVRRDPDSLIG